MEMTLKLTEKDKKLVGLLSVVILIAGVGFGIIQPILSRSSEMEAQIELEQADKEVKEMKVTNYPTVAADRVNVMENIADLRENFYELMASKDIDKLLTGMALQENLIVTNLTITMPNTGEYASIQPYTADTASSEPDTSNTKIAYSGVYNSSVQLTVTGAHESLQKLLDTFAGLEPKIQILSYSWQSPIQGQTESTALGITLNLYMCDDTDTFIAEQAELAAESEAAESSETEAPTDLLN